MTKKNIYFASDFHLGSSKDEKNNLDRENRIIDWLESIEDKAKAIYFVGDTFDYWFEHKEVIPRGFSGFLGKLSDLRRKGIDIFMFTGNHDLWMFDFFPLEYGIPVYKEPQYITLGDKTFYIAHGDGLGPGDHRYKMLKKVLTNSLCQWCFARLHPNLSLKLMKTSSRISREKGHDIQRFLGEDKEWLVIHSKEILKKSQVDFFIYGHRHLPIDYVLNGSRYINLGDWIKYFSYAVFDGEELKFEFYKSEYSEPYS